MNTTDFPGETFAGGESRQTQADLRLANFVMENASVGIFVGSVDGRFTHVNHAACAMTGYTRDELLRMSVSDLDPVFSASSNERELALLRNAGSNIVETRHRHKDGRTYPVRIATNLLEFEGVEYVISFVRDTTADQEAERQKAHLEAQLVEAQKMEALGYLTGGIAHDFNNSLTVILGFAALLSSKEGLDDYTRRTARRIADAADQSKSLVAQLLGFSRQQIIAPEPLNLNRILLGSYDILARLVGEDIALEILPARDLADVMLDRTQVDQIVMNLAANARDAMPHGGRLILETSNVSVDEAYALQNPLARPGEYVVLAASDTGVGMDQETTVRAFEPFFTTKARGKGTGLGLATVYGIVRQNDGFIHVYSEPGHGTTFRIYFPRSRQSGIVQEPARDRIGQGKDAADRSAGTILVAEDDDLVRDMTIDTLQLLGYTALAAARPSEAVAVCENPETSIDLAIIDVVMPEMSGTDLRNRLHELRPDLPVLFVSGYTSTVVLRHGVLRPDVHFLQKPYTIEDLSSKIREIMAPKERELRRNAP